jgi:hypothetical protein
MFRKLPEKTIKQILKVFNKSVASETVPDGMKESVIIMIPKKSDDPHSPTNYRPISLTSSLGKLLERIMCSRLYRFLNDNNLLIQEQSGLREEEKNS